MAHFHVAEADKDPVGHCTVPYRKIPDRPEPQLVKAGLHIQKQPAPGNEVHLQNMIRKRLYRLNVPPFQKRPPLPEKVKPPYL